MQRDKTSKDGLEEWRAPDEMPHIFNHGGDAHTTACGALASRSTTGVSVDVAAMAGPARLAGERASSP
eukprot:scaffold3236_cov36-Tisochrysis_lutea.AAC.2